MNIFGEEEEHVYVAADIAPNLVSISHLERVKTFLWDGLPSNDNLEVEPTRHVSHRVKAEKGYYAGVRTHGSFSNLTTWYRALPETVKNYVENAGFAPFMQVICDKKRSRELIGALSELWWDSTNTFHFTFGEMTLTPFDFSMLTGVPCGRNHLYFDTDLARDPPRIMSLLGDTYPAHAHPSGKIPCSDLLHHFRDYVCHTDADYLHLFRGFMLYMLGTSLFANQDNSVHLGLITNLYTVETVRNIRWAEASVAYLYASMGGLSRDLIHGIAGFYPVWEVLTLFTVLYFRCKYLVLVLMHAFLTDVVL